MSFLYLMNTIHQLKIETSFQIVTKSSWSFFIVSSCHRDKSCGICTKGCAVKKGQLFSRDISGTSFSACLEENTPSLKTKAVGKIIDSKSKRQAMWVWPNTIRDTFSMQRSTKFRDIKLKETGQSVTVPKILNDTNTFFQH